MSIAKTRRVLTRRRPVSWVVESDEHGQKQMAYQIVVAESSEGLLGTSMRSEMTFWPSVDVKSLTLNKGPFDWWRLHGNFLYL